eukprot:6755023-Pyramimonas_sp.AAC.1
MIHALPHEVYDDLLVQFGMLSRSATTDDTFAAYEISCSSVANLTSMRHWRGIVARSVLAKLCSVALADFGELD